MQRILLASRNRGDRQPEHIEKLFMEINKFLHTLVKLVKKAEENADSKQPPSTIHQITLAHWSNCVSTSFQWFQPPPLPQSLFHPFPSIRCSLVHYISHASIHRRDRVVENIPIQRSAPEMEMAKKEKAQEERERVRKKEGKRKNNTKAKTSKI